ncbi:uncharacterized protein LOC143212043 isoform X2 [Lasioglossum baleicum]|uniref:uncharacterized protein LOC143212043 isoform X2 n=1 Tax=Lasioglossum baleicum TaxID=434251 RepID=UPI003FCCD493
MRIAHMVTVCAALIPAFHRAETVQPDRLQKRDQPPHPRKDNVTDISEITFTTLQPETFNPNIHFSVHSASSKMLKLRPGRSMSRVRQNRFNVGRRRRQLQKNGGNLVRIGRSYETSGENHIDHQVESVQGPPEAFDEGAVHLEPVYRVTKNKNFIDTLVNILRRLVNPPKSIGPLVGPFHFPGVGEKVYIRLLEPVQPDNLVIRFVSSLPVNEIETTFDKSNLPPEELLKHSAVIAVGQEGSPHPPIPENSHDIVSHSDIPIISHEPLPLSTDTLRNSYGQHIKPGHTFPDTLLSSHEVSQVFKSSPAIHAAAVVTSQSRTPHISRTYKVNLKNGEPVAIQRVVRHRKRVQYPQNGHPNSNSHSSSAEKGESQKQESHQVNSYQGPIAPNYQFPWENNTKTVSSENSQGASSQQKFKWDPITQKPSIWDQLRFNDSRSAENNPRYSIQFFSKKMRYLNLDGSVDTRGDPSSKEEGFRPLQPQVSRSVAYWESLKNGNPRNKRGHAQSAEIKQDPKSFRERSDAIVDSTERSGTLENDQTITASKMVPKQTGSKEKEEKENGKITTGSSGSSNRR